MINGLGERLQEQRTTHKLSQREVALALNVSPTVISNYEKGERTPSLEMLIALARFYHCSTDYLGRPCYVLPDKDTGAINGLIQAATAIYNDRENRFRNQIAKNHLQSFMLIFTINATATSTNRK